VGWPPAPPPRLGGVQGALVVVLSKKEEENVFPHLVLSQKNSNIRNYGAKPREAAGIVQERRQLLG
jgi:hypothetical protein